MTLLAYNQLPLTSPQPLRLTDGVLICRDGVTLTASTIEQLLVPHKAESDPHPQYVSTLQFAQTLNLYAPLLSPGFLGAPTVPTAPPGLANNQIANTEFVSEAIAGALSGALPGIFPATSITLTDPATSTPTTVQAYANTLYSPSGAGQVRYLGQLSGAMPRTLASKGYELISVADYGIFPDGTDYSARMQNLVNAASTAGKVAISVPPDRSPYVMQWVMKSGVFVLGAPGAYGQNFISGGHYGSQILCPVGGGRVIDWTAPTGPDPEGGTNLQTGIMGLVIFGRGSGTPCRGVNVQAARNPIIHDVAIYSTADEAFYVDDNVRLGKFTQLGGYNCIQNRSRSSTTYAARLGGGDHIIDDWEFNPALTALSSSNLYIRAIGILGDNVRVSNIIGEFSDVGVTVLGTLHHFNGANRGEFSYAKNWEIGCTASNLGDIFSNTANLSGGSYGAIHLLSSSGNNIVNSWLDTHGSPTYGLRDDYAGGDTNKNLIGKGLSGSATVQLVGAPASGSSFEIPSGSFKRAPTGSTPSLNNYSNWQMFNSSPTSITRFSNTVPGQNLYIRGDGNATLVHDGVNFQLPSNANLLLSSGKVYHFVVLDTLLVTNVGALP